MGVCEGCGCPFEANDVEYGVQLLTRQGVHVWRRFCTPACIEDYAEQYGLRIREPSKAGLLARLSQTLGF
jgi:hypothetical protein